jgi:ATP-dependent DNA helicase RecG
MLLTSPLTTLHKFTKPQSAALKKLGLKTVRDLLFFFPYRYLDFSKVTTIRELQTGEASSIQVTIKNISGRFSFKSHLSIAEAAVSDDTGSIKVVWFNQGYLAKHSQQATTCFFPALRITTTAVSN